MQIFSVLFVVFLLCALLFVLKCYAQDARDADAWREQSSASDILGPVVASRMQTFDAPPEIVNTSATAVIAWYPKMQIGGVTRYADQVVWIKYAPSDEKPNGYYLGIALWR